jgi:hypothetical protein
MFKALALDDSNCDASCNCGYSGGGGDVGGQHYSHSQNAMCEVAVAPTAMVGPPYVGR